MRAYANGGPNNITWASAKAKSAEVKSYPAFETRNQNVFARYARKFSTGMGLPTFNGDSDKDYAEKEKLGRGRWQAGGRGYGSNLLRVVGNNLRRGKLLVLVPFCIVCGFLLYILVLVTRKSTLSFHVACIAN